VVLCHAGTVLGDPFGGILRAGHAGVDFFFVLSGFIIATVHRDDLGRAGRLPSYARKRLSRIYPIYWIATCIALGLWWLGVVPLNNVAPGGVARSLLLWPQHLEPTLGVAWTLEHEMLFYLTFGLLILHRTIGMILFAGWTCFIVGELPFAPSTLPWANADLLTGFVGSSYNLQFGLGIAAAMLAQRFRTPFPLLLTATGVTGLLLACAAEDAELIGYMGQPERALLGLSSALVILGLAAAERSGRLRANRFLVFIGAASYAIYLIHVPVEFAVSSLIASLLPAWLNVSVLALIGIGGGALLHAVAEKPLLRALRPHAPVPRRQAVAAPAAVAREPS